MRGFSTNKVARKTLGTACLFLASLTVLSCHSPEVVTKTGLVRKTVSQGDIVTLHPASAPFPHPRRQDGFSYDDKEYDPKDHYSDSSVCVFFPRNWKEGPTVNLVFFFHGWFSSIDDSLERFNLIDQFTKSRVNALLVLPETARDAPDSFGGKLEDPDGFQDLVEEVLNSLQKGHLLRGVKPGKIVLTGHSGAYHVIGQILTRGGLRDHVKDVVLFDALYGSLDDFEQWIDRRSGRFFSVFAEGGDAVAYNYTLIDDLVHQGVPLLLENENLEGSALPSEVHAAFFRSDQDHYGVVNSDNQFQRLLQSVFRTKP